MQFVLVHGVYHGAWCWEGTVADLERAGHTAVAVDLPLTSLEDDSATVIAALDGLDGPTVLVGHSYGGLVISKAGAGRSDLERLVYVAAVMIKPDEIFMELAPNYPVPIGDHTVFDDSGTTFSINPEGAVESFYERCDKEAALQAVSKLRPTAVACLMSPTGVAAWQELPSTYILCQEDKAISPTWQTAMSANATAVVELATDHSPFMSMPEEFLDILTTAASSTTTDD